MTEEQLRQIDSDLDALKKTMAAGAVGSVLGALLWKKHRVWGFLLGGMLASNLYRLATQ